MVTNSNEKWAIVFIDDGEQYHRFETNDKTGTFTEYGDVMTFDSKDQAQAYLDTLDSREFERYVKKMEAK